MEIQTKQGVFNIKKADLIAYLKDLSHFHEFLPEEKIENWQADSHKCSFKVKGLSKISLIFQGIDEKGNITLVSGKESPIDFSLYIIIEEKEPEKSSTGYMIFKGKVNPFMRMMIENPLQNFFDGLVTRLEEKYQ
jgi:hypothetical protein